MEHQCLSTQLPQDENGKFAAFIKSREKTVLRKIIRSNRRRAFQMKDDEVPPRVYTNQSETVNSILPAKKLALGYSKKEDIAKAHFVKCVWQGAVKHQKNEIGKAIINQSVEYRLAPAAQYLSVPVEVWYQWSQSYRQKYLKLIKSFEKKDIDAQKIIDIEDWGGRENNLQQVKESLSIKLSESLPNLLHAETIEKKALVLLKNPTALVLSRSVIVKKKRGKFT